MAITLTSRELSTSWIDATRRRRLLILGVGGFVLSLLLVRFVLAFNLAAAAVVLVVLAVLAIAVQPRIGLYVLLALVLFFEMSYDPIMEPGYYLANSLQTTLKLNGGILEPMEMLQLTIVIFWLARAAMQQRLQFQGGSIGWPVLLFALALVAGVMRGFLSGGNPQIMVFEVRYLIAMALTYMLTTNLIRTRAHVRTLTTITLVCTGLSGLEAVWRRFALIDTGELVNQTGGIVSPEAWFAHETPVFWGILVLVVLGQHAFGGPRWQRFFGIVALMGTSVAFLISQRRAGIIAVAVAFLAFSLVLLFTRRKAFCWIALPVLLAGAVYLPVFWNSGGTLGQGARAVRSISSPDPRDAASNAWRDTEAINVRATILSEPLLGVGFGMPFLQIAHVPDISTFAFWNYESHHGILWVWMKVGAIGFTLFFTVLGTGIARSAWLIKTLRDPTSRTFALVAMSSIMMSAVFCYVDLGLTTNRIPILLGVMIGTVAVLDRVRDKDTYDESQGIAKRTSL